jgi:hypothetical protein
MITVTGVTGILEKFPVRLNGKDSQSVKDERICRH